MAGDGAHRGSDRRTGLQGRFVGHIRVYGGVHDGLRGFRRLVWRNIGPSALPLSGGACYMTVTQNRLLGAGWSSPVARQAHNLKVVGSNPTPATNLSPQKQLFSPLRRVFSFIPTRF